MTRKSFFLFTFLIFLFLLINNACDKKVAKPAPPVQVNACDSITYEKHIKPIISQKCLLSGCHADNPPPLNVYLDTYDHVKVQALNGKLKGVIIDGVPEFMPKGSQGLPQNERDLFNCWLNNGLK